jgi:hypothetical protein
MRVYVVQDAEGRIVGTAPVGAQEVKTSLPGAPLAHARSKGKGEQEEEALQVTIVAEPMPGQSVHEIELPAELKDLEGDDLANALPRYRVTSGDAKLVERGGKSGAR